MPERLKALRKALGLTQEAFGAKIALSQSAIAAYEKEFREPSDAIIYSICREFNVREQWLRTGEGEMFVPLDREDELTRFFGQIITAGAEDTRYRIIHALSRMDVSAWETLDDALRKLLEAYQEEQKNADP